MRSMSLRIWCLPLLMWDFILYIFLENVFLCETLCRKKNHSKLKVFGVWIVFFLTFFPPLLTDYPLYFGRGKGSVVWAKLSDVSKRSVLKKELLAV